MYFNYFKRQFKKVYIKINKTNHSFKNIVTFEQFSFKSYIYIRVAYDTFPNFFRIGTFIDSTRMKL